MYEAITDPYCYRGTNVLKNIPGLRDAVALGRFEAAITAQRADERFPAGRLTVRHYQSIHRTLNAIHPFRDGNGRLQQLDPAGFLAAMITSFQGDEQPLIRQIRGLMTWREE